MKNFAYDGDYPGYVNGTWKVDEKDGHIWINLPNVVPLQGFPYPFSLHFMESPKEYGRTNFIMSDEVMVIDDFKFDTILKKTYPKVGEQDYYGTVVGHEIDQPVPAHVPKGVTIGSIVIKSKHNNKPIAVINLRSVLALDIVRKVKLRFGVDVRVATYGLATFKDVDLTKGRFMTGDIFYVPAPVEHYRDKRVLVSSPEDYQQFLSSLTNNEQWFSEYSKMQHYSLGSLVPPDFKLITNAEGFTVVNLEGRIKMISGFTGIKSIMIPFCPGISAVIRFTSFTEDSKVYNHLDTTKENFINFNIVTTFAEVIR